jgi:hypothetical protein
VALSWSRSSQPTRTVRASMEGDVWKFSVDGQVAILDWTSGLARPGKATMPASSPAHEPPILPTQ